MTLGEKIRYLREVEGALRGLDREMTQQEVVRAVKKEQRKPISQSYLSQIESGARPPLPPPEHPLAGGAPLPGRGRRALPRPPEKMENSTHSLHSPDTQPDRAQ